MKEYAKRVAHCGLISLHNAWSHRLSFPCRYANKLEMTGSFTRHVIATDVPGVHMVKLLDIDGDDMFDVCYAYNDGLGWCVFMLCACVCTSAWVWKPLACDVTLV
jgi:hypothetical protein